ncbi:MAG: glycosyltransferase family 4 protein [Pseudomonas sp.]
MKIYKDYCLLFVQSQPSQLDAPFYSSLSRKTDGAIAVALLNDSSERRTDIDPELGFVPNFSDLPHDYQIVKLSRGKKGGVKLIWEIWKNRPKMVVLQDQSWGQKIIIAIASRFSGSLVAMRSDKNLISENARAGGRLWIERFFVRLLFDVLVPVSELTLNYYGWMEKPKIWPFPYPSFKAKFSRGDLNSCNADIRKYFGIAISATVFLGVTKFVTRENPHAILRAFARAKKINSDICLILVGAGALEAELKNFVVNQNLSDVYFPGYVAYGDLQKYFHASDVFLHLANSEPWGISAQDALVAEMGLVTSDKVGAGVWHLRGELAQYVVPVDDDEAAAEAMLKLAGPPEKREHFWPAWESVRGQFTEEALAQIWAEKLSALGWTKQEDAARA